METETHSDFGTQVNQQMTDGVNANSGDRPNMDDQKETNTQLAQILTYKNHEIKKLPEDIKALHDNNQKLRIQNLWLRNRLKGISASPNSRNLPNLITHFSQKEMDKGYIENFADALKKRKNIAALLVTKRREKPF
jgi:hypothetical protein